MRHHVAKESHTPFRVPACRIVQRRYAFRAASYVRHLVEIWFAVLLREPFPGNLEHAELVVARDEQRRGVQREPARRIVMCHGTREDVTAFLPERHQVEPAQGEPAQSFECAFAYGAVHSRDLSGPRTVMRRNTTDSWYIRLSSRFVLFCELSVRSSGPLEKNL